MLVTIDVEEVAAAVDEAIERALEPHSRSVACLIADNDRLCSEVKTLREHLAVVQEKVGIVRKPVVRVVAGRKVVR